MCVDNFPEYKGLRVLAVCVQGQKFVDKVCA